MNIKYDLVLVEFISSCIQSGVMPGKIFPSCPMKILNNKKSTEEKKFNSTSFSHIGHDVYEIKRAKIKY